MAAARGRAGRSGLLVWSLTGFFNGIGRSRLTLLVTVVMALANIPFNQFFIFTCHLGIAGSAWGTVAAEVVGLALALAFFLGAPRAPSLPARTSPGAGPRSAASSRSACRWASASPPTSLGLALFQLMLVSYSTAAGAATQIA